MADTKAAAMNFLNVLEHIPNIVEQYKTKNEAIEKDLPILQEVAGKGWKKEDELKQLKSELAALDRKIQLELAPLPVQEKTEMEDVDIQSNLCCEQSELSNESLPKKDYRADFIREHIVSSKPNEPHRGIKLS